MVENASFRGLWVVIAALMLLGCGAWLGGKEAQPLPGERISIMLFQRDLTPDPRIADLDIRLPKPEINDDWPQSGGYADHAMHHLKVAEIVTEAWRVDIGAGSGAGRRLLSPPVVVDGTVYAADVNFIVGAFRATDGRRLWRFDPKVPKNDKEAFGGGIAYENGHIFLTTGFAVVFAIDASDGTEVWRKPTSGPIRAAPTATGGRIYVITIDNEITAYNAATGEKLWSHSGFAEAAGILGGASPAVSGSTVVVPYSSGEIYALRVENGRVIWFDNLSAVRRLDQISSLTDIRGRPVIDRGLVLAISHSGRMVAIDQRTGARAWDRKIGGVEMPWVAGDFIYLVTNESELVSLTRRGGRVRWITPLPRFVDAKNKEDLIHWSGPILVSDRLVVVASYGEALSISPYTGKILGRVKLPAGASLAPVVAGGTLYIITDKAQLIALR
jgi:outer membrane protein assembly factor BamB